MIEMGLIVGLGLLVSLVKMTWTWKIRVLSAPLIMDAIIFILLMMLHWGSFAGVMVATIGALSCSLVLSGARWGFGYVEQGVYVPGIFDVSNKI